MTKRIVFLLLCLTMISACGIFDDDILMCSAVPPVPETVKIFIQEKGTGQPICDAEVTATSDNYENGQKSFAFESSPSNSSSCFYISNIGGMLSIRANKSGFDEATAVIDAQPVAAAFDSCTGPVYETKELTLEMTPVSS